jgi:hypothetical protein
VSPGDVNPGSDANARFAAKQFQSQAFRIRQCLNPEVSNLKFDQVSGLGSATKLYKPSSDWHYG